jgi:hypothetical protein
MYKLNLYNFMVLNQHKLFHQTGVLVNHVDIAPKHAGILMGIANTIGSFTGFAAPYVCGLLINNDVSENRNY